MIISENYSDPVKISVNYNFNNFNFLIAQPSCYNYDSATLLAKRKGVFLVSLTGYFTLPCKFGNNFKSNKYYYV